MDTRSKKLILLILILSILSVGYSFYNTVIIQDFDTFDSSTEEIE